jgi:hypothetical protein
MCLIALKEDDEIMDSVTEEVKAKIKRAMDGEVF